MAAAAASFIVAPAEVYDSYTSAGDYALRGDPSAQHEARRLVQTLCDEGALAPGASVLDLGCGAGFLLGEAAKISPSGRHNGVDASSAMTANACTYHSRDDHVDAARLSANRMAAREETF